MICERKAIRGNLSQDFNAVLLSPHSDDIALSLGAFLLCKSSALQVHIITVFSISECTVEGYTKGSTVVSTLRKAEDACLVKSLGGTAKAKWLDRRDAPIRLHIPDEAVFCSELTDLCLNEVRNIVSRMKEDYSSFDLIFTPMALGNHIDHIVVRNAGLELLKEGFPVIFYEDIPYAADLSLIDVYENAAQLGTLARQKLALFAIETGVSIEEKIALLSCYRSQMDSRTEDRVRSHSDRFDMNSVIERVWASKIALSAIQHILKGDRS